MKTSTLTYQSAVKKGFKAAIIGGSAIFALTAMVQAVPTPAPISIATNQQITADATINTGFLGGIQIAGSPVSIVTVPIAGGNNSGAITEWVYREASGNLDFYYQLSLPIGATANISQFDIFGLTQPGLKLNVFTDNIGTDLPGGLGGGVLVTTFQGSSPSTLDVNFSSAEIQAGENSVIFGYQSNQQFDAFSTTLSVDGGFATGSGLLVPVPEPTGNLFGFALVGVVGIAVAKRFTGFTLPGFAI